MIEFTEEQRRELSVPEPVAIDREHEQALEFRAGAGMILLDTDHISILHRGRAQRRNVPGAGRVATVDGKHRFQPAERTTPRTLARRVAMPESARRRITTAAFNRRYATR